MARFDAAERDYRQPGFSRQSSKARWPERAGAGMRARGEERRDEQYVRARPPRSDKLAMIVDGRAVEPGAASQAPQVPRLPCRLKPGKLPTLLRRSGSACLSF